FVDQALAVLDPLRPRLLRDRVVDSLAQGVVEWLVREAGQGLTELGAFHHTSHRAWHSTKFRRARQASGDTQTVPRTSRGRATDHSGARSTEERAWAHLSSASLKAIYRAIKDRRPPWMSRSGSS